MSSLQYNNNYQLVGEELGRIFIRFKYYSPPKKFALLEFSSLVTSLR